LGSFKGRGRLQAALQQLPHLLARRPKSFGADLFEKADVPSIDLDALLGIGPYKTNFYRLT